MTYTIEQIAKEIYDINEVYEYQRKTVEELRSETFEDVSRVHDWRNYVSVYSDPWIKNLTQIRKGWQKLTDLQMILTYANAVKEAEKEYWD